MITRCRREIPGAGRRSAALVLLLLLPGCPSVDVSQPIELVPEGDWDTSWTDAVKRTASCWNMEFGTLLGVGAGTEEQQVPVRFNDFVCAYAAGRVEPAPPVQINICRHYFARPDYSFHRMMLHELGHVLNIHFHAEDPLAVMVSGENLAPMESISGFSAEDRRLFREANEGFEPRSPCLAHTMSSSDEGIECHCFRLAAEKGPLPAQDMADDRQNGLWVMGEKGTVLHLENVNRYP